MSEQEQPLIVGDVVNIVLSPSYNVANGKVVDILSNAGRRHETLYIIQSEFGSLNVTGDQIKPVTEVH